MRRVILLLMLLSLTLPLMAQGKREGREVREERVERTERKERNVRNEVDSVGRMVTKNRFMPTGKRIDREIKKNVFAYKGELALGLTASYGTLTSEDSDILALLENIKAAGSVTTVSPFVSYFIANNMSVGVRMGYTSMDARLDDMDLNLGSGGDIALSIPWVDMSSNTLRMSAFVRNYTSIDEAGRFGVFSELEASYAFGGNTMGFRMGADSPTSYNDSQSATVKISFNPGLAVYMFPNVCATISFGMGGFKYTKVKQYNDVGELTGERTQSKLQFRLNLADIYFGLNIHLWGKNKK